MSQRLAATHRAVDQWCPWSGRSRVPTHLGDELWEEPILPAIGDRIVVARRGMVSVRLTPSAYAHGLALALPEKVAVARPTGVGRALATYEIPIEGRDEWVAAARSRTMR